MQVAAGGGAEAHCKACWADRPRGPSATVPEVDFGIPPDSDTPTDGQDIPDGDSQPLLGVEEDSQSWGTLSLRPSLLQERRDPFVLDGVQQR